MRDTTSFENRLLSAARSDVVPAALSERMSQALGLSMGTSVAGTSAGASTSAGTGTGTGTGTVGTVAAGMTKVGSILVLGAVLMVAAGGLFYRGLRAHQKDGPPIAPETTPTRTVSPSPAPAVMALPRTADPSTEELAQNEPAQKEAVAPHRRETAQPSLEVDVKQEIGLLDAARGRLTAGQPRSALALLTQYDRRFPHGTFAPEALALRIEGNVAAGDSATARVLARRFLKEHRDSPLAGRVELLTHLPH